MTDPTGPDGETERDEAMQVGRPAGARTPETFVIVGGGLAGAKAAETLRTEGYEGRIVLLADEEERPYERPPLSKGYLTGSDPRDVAFVHDTSWYAEHDVDLRRGVRATMLDTTRHLLTLDGYHELRYDQLLLATGSWVRQLDVPGGTLPGVRYLRTIEDADLLLARFRAAGDRGRLVVVGAGWIGLEVAAAARAHGLDVTVVEPEPTPLHRVLGAELGGFFTTLHTDHGVRFRFGTGVTEFRGTSDAVSGVVLGDGTELPADLVVVGVGIRPAVELATAGGLAVDNGIVTDEHLRTSAQDVYACGDVANSLRPWLGRRIRVEHWSNALDGGIAAAHAMLGHHAPYDQVPFFFSDQYDLGLEYSGYVDDVAAPDVEVVYRGDVAAREFVAFWLRGDRLLAGMNVNVWDVSQHVEAIVRAGRPVDRARLTDPAVPLESLVQA
ncbi:NAD(P)/FAD-dependent oxidoreductase [Actinocatenispora rupis]|uniref:Ferredoxin n=1 Tax=Actinocatenispora rupis TaxID=519421 RepID=A0A8J3IZ50_9ACTN|nr:FAD-dependent oxidoreductase [Actinocatenispora rupis]GID11490.1 ferredoxin [Actinocatenispora rupis]